MRLRYIIIESLRLSVCVTRGAACKCELITNSRQIKGPKRRSTDSRCFRSTPSHHETGGPCRLLSSTGKGSTEGRTEGRKEGRKDSKGNDGDRLTNRFPRLHSPLWDCSPQPRAHARAFTCTLGVCAVRGSPPHVHL